MNNLTQYNDFLSEGILSSVSNFLKTYYNKIFQDPNPTLNNIFNDFTKRLDNEKNIPNFYQRFTRRMVGAIRTEIDAAQSIDAVNKLVTDSIKYFYFSLRPVITKLQNDKFTMETVLSNTGDRSLQGLMIGDDPKIITGNPEDKFLNALKVYVSQTNPPGVFEQLKKNSGLDKQNVNNQTNQQNNQPSSESASDRIKYNIYKILEADENTTPTTTDPKELKNYKDAATSWTNNLFDLLTSHFNVLNSLNTNTSMNIDQLVKQMKGSNNNNAKQTIINKIFNMDREQLQNLANTLGLKEDVIGKL